ncbi:phosphate acetyltransferase [Salsipaludibacter albus]|uniref:phosphate acetyltransferase n=1 Tax=Salsipaludibacter albus TaxID=2849650 RepID=UPI001EE3DC95|nr:phosphate acetyltransferase [Salsipaludibacter albus]MBY5161498.1 phosphate acetyltransferase [Salsipaludibacter albus]
MSSTSARALYLAAVEPQSGKSLVALGLMEVLSRRVGRLGYFRPVVTGDDDHRVALMRERYQLDGRAAYAWTDEQVDSLLAEGREDEVVKGVIEAYRQLAAECRFVVIEGSDQTGTRSALEFEFNARLASNLGASVVAVLHGQGQEPREVAEHARLTQRMLADEGVTTTAIVVNRAARDDLDELREALGQLDVVTSAVPEHPVLGMPTHGEVVAALGAREVVVGPLDSEVPVTSVKVAAMSLPNLLSRLEDGALVIAPGDRPDVLVGVLASRLSDTQPDVAGLILSGGLDPAPEILDLLAGLGGVPMPIHAVDTDTYDTAEAVSRVSGVIRTSSGRKIATALGLFEEHVDVDALLDRLEVARSDRVTPMMFEFDLIERARQDRRHIVLPEGTDGRVLRAASLLRARNVVDLTVLGDPEDVRRAASAAGAELDDIRIVDPATSEDRHRYARAYVEARSHKGMVLDRAEEVMGDVSYFGTMMVHLGDADGMVSGAAHTTAHTIRPAFEFVGTREGVSSVSSVFLMCLPDRVLVYGDCAIIPNPTPEQLADIAVSSAATARMFGIEPAVAMLSYSTGTSGAGEDVDRVTEATRLAREAAPDLAIEGPIQYDAAVDAGVGRKKLPESSVAGHATVFVFPDLNTGNNTYKAVQRSAGAIAIGPVLQGLRKPVNDLSRGCLVDDIVNTVAITAIQAQEADATGDATGDEAGDAAGHPATP